MFTHLSQSTPARPQTLQDSSVSQWPSPLFMVSFGNRVQTVGVHMHRVEEKGCAFLSGQKSASDPDSLTQDRSPKQTINFLGGQSADWEDTKRGGQKVTCRPWAASSYSTWVPVWRDRSPSIEGAPVFVHRLEKVEDLCIIFNHEHQWEWKCGVGSLGIMKRGWVVIRRVTASTLKCRHL